MSTDKRASNTTTQPQHPPQHPPPPMVNAADTPVAADHPNSEPSPTTSTAETNANSTTTNGKRKRSENTPAPTPNTGNSTMKDKDTAEKRKQVMADIVKDLLVVLKEHDPSPASIINHPIPASQTLEAPPNKRAKLSSTPSTIADKLAAGSYPTLNPLLADITAVCRALLASLPNGAQPNGSEQDALVAQIVHFEEFARDVITRERLRRADLFDFAEEFSGDESGKAGGKVALTVMGHHGPLFSSLQNPTPVAAPRTEMLSRSSSISGSSTSTAPTSTCTSPKTGPLKVYRVIAPLNESNLPPLVSTVKAVSGDVPKSLKRSAPEKVPTLGEAFPPVRISSLAPPKPNSASATLGLKWGGAIGPGGAAVPNTSLERPDPTGEWLTYRNHPPRDSKHKPRRGEPIRLGMGLPADFVIAYSSFAPTRDDSGAKVPSGIRNRVWWERRGGQVFRRIFGNDPGIGHLYHEYDAKPPVEAITDTPEDTDEELLRQAVENWEPDSDVPIDFRLLDTPSTPSETLTEISSLLQTLRSHQYLRLSTIRASTPTPTPEEQTLYTTLQSRLSTLVASLPPHTTTTTSGSPLAPLSISSKIPLTTGTPIYTGTLPDPPTVPSAAIAAINAAVGISPPAPVAMMRMNVPVPAPPPTPTRVLGAPHVSYHAHHMPYYHGTTPHHYPSPYAPSPFPPQQQQPQPPQVQQFHGHSMPGGQRRVNVPPPQGLAAVGVGYGREGLRMGVQHTQASMENGVVPGGRYAGRSRR